MVSGCQPTVKATRKRRCSGRVLEIGLMMMRRKGRIEIAAALSRSQKKKFANGNRESRGGEKRETKKIKKQYSIESEFSISHSSLI